MVKLPSDLSDERDHKLTRRRLMSVLKASGFSAGTVAVLGVEDVKAASDDQVVLSLDFEGNEKRTVPADWYDRVVRARRARSELSERFLNREGVLGVFSGSGEFGGKNPRVEVVLQHKSPQKEERRGEIPERANNTDVEITESEQAEGHAACTNYDDSAELVPYVPGGARASVLRNDATGTRSGTLTSMIRDADAQFHGEVMSAAHIFCARESDTVYTSDGCDQCTAPIGRIERFVESQDFAIIKTYDDVYALDEIAENTDFQTGARYEIKGTLTQDGVNTVEANGTYVFLYGYGGCVGRGTINKVGDQQFNFNCIDTTLNNTVRYGDARTAQNGDSGSEVFVTPKGTSDYYGVALHQGASTVVQPARGRSYSFGTGGYYLKNNWGYDWGDGAGANE